jgi:hypothetical protein
MKKFWVLALVFLILPSNVLAQDVVSPVKTLSRNTMEVPICTGTCVPPSDMKVFLQLLKNKKCQLSESPKFDLDPIQITVDKKGRIFFSGDHPHPYKLRMSWCNYAIEAEGKVDVVAGMVQPPIWGFRLRPKAYMAFLPTELTYNADSRELGDLLDAGFMLDFLYYDWANLNAVVGYQSVGVGVGVDLTENFGAYTGYAITWGDWHHNMGFGVWFGF